MALRTFLDTGVLMAAHHGEEALCEAAMKIIEDSDREFIITSYIKLELLPKPVYEKRKHEEEFYETYFSDCEFIQSSASFSSQALTLAKKYGLGSVDALHITAAILANANELITAEKPTSPMFRVDDIEIKTIYTKPVTTVD